MKNRSKVISGIVVLSVFFSFCPQSVLQADTELGLKLNRTGSLLVPFFVDNQPRGLSLGDTSYYLLKTNPSSFKRSTQIDSSAQVITIRETILDEELRFSASIPLNRYIQLGRERRLTEFWQEKRIKSLTEDPTGGKRGHGGVDIDIPVKIKSRAFQQIFGGSTVGLTVTGDITINGGFRHEKRSEVKTALTRGSDYNFKMNQTQRFKVQGRVGEKVTVGVDQDSERPFEFENTIRLKYDGLEDEIVQNIEAGNIALSLPATRFVSFSGKNSGLFGIKTDMIVGNLNITAIASQEKGENKKLTLTGGAEGATKQIRDYDYLKNTYFFLDEYYRNKYWELDDEGRHKFDPAKVISQLEVYKSAAGYESKQGSIRGWAVLDPANPDTSATGEASQEKYVGYFLRLDKNEYFLEPDLGYIRMDSPVPEGEVLAVAYKDTSSPEPVGDLYFDPLTKSTIVLKIIKPRSPLPGDKTWNLAWRHVYSLGSRNIPPEGFELKIFYDTPSGDDQETITIDGKPKSFLAVFGLDRKDLNGNPNPDNIVDNNPNIIRLSDGELEFLHPRPFDPNPAKLDELGLSPEAKEDTKIELPKNLWTPAIYDTNVQNYITSQSKFYIEVKSKTRSANYSLGFNVIEGSEEVRLNGQTLQRGTDYIIDYFSGNLTILNENATSPSANLEVTYQRNELFQLEKKTLLGMRAEYNLWENSFIGGTMLYLNQRTLDQKVRVGEGPMRNFIWDVNTRLGFKPDFLTRAVDALPFIETKDQSTLNVEAEFAQIIPNPNTLNNENTDDPDGVAYIDDFEAAERPSPLGVMRRGWTPCSPPKEFYDEEKIIDGLPRKTFGLDRMGRLIWYNPYRQVPIKEIWPGRDVNPNVPQGVHVLVLEFTPADSSAGLFPFPPENSWAGLQRYLSAGYADQSESKFLEVWVKGDHGTLHIDLGQISEDVIPNGKLDTEDKLVNQIRNGILDAGEDVGLDGMPGRDPDDFWDIFPLKAPNGLRDWGEPLSYDDWHYTGASEEYSHINGTEGNERDGDAVRVPDTEDINGNGGLDTQNDYFEYSFSLDKNSPDTIYIAGGKGNPYGWRLYRLPLREPHKVVGKPTLSRIEYARLWVDGFSRKGQISLAEINLTGNQWRELGLALSDTAKPDASNDSTVAVTVISTHDNPQYEPPPGVAGIRDRITQVVGKEQSLVLRLTDLPPGANGSVQKTLYQTQSYIDYHKMKMFVHGGDVNLQNFSEDTTQIEYFIRFGADTSNYYEYRAPVYRGWDKRNYMEIDLNELASLKLDPNYVKALDVVKYLGGGRSYRIRGKPSLTGIRQIVLGVKNIGNTFFSGEVWFNELRLSQVKKDKGIAMRARVDFKLADLLTLNGEINRQDADFHNINTRFGSGDNQLGGNFNGNLNLHKFLPLSWGISLPVNFNYTENRARPKYFPGSDILVTSDTPDTIVQKIQSIQKQQGFSISFRKGSRSKNFFLRNTLDALSVTYNQAQGHGSNSSMQYQNRRSHSGNVTYNFDFGKNRFFTPFSWLGRGPIVKKLSEMKFYYLPTGLNLTMSLNRSRDQSLTRTGVVTDNQIFNVSRSLKTGLKPFESLTFDYTRTYASDMHNTPAAMLLKAKFGENTSIDQSISARYNPKIVSWLTSNFSFSAGYKWANNLQQKITGRSVNNNTSISSSFSFNPNQMVKSIFKTGKKGAGATGPGRRPTKPPQKTPDEEKDSQKKKDSQTKEKKPEQKGGFFLLEGLDKFTQKLQPISLTYSNQKSSRYLGLKEGMNPSFNYQLGLEHQIPKEYIEESIGTRSSSFNEIRSFSANTGVKITSNIDVSLKYSSSTSRNEATTITGDVSQSWLQLGDQGQPFPEWTLRWSGLEKFSIFKKFAQRVSLDHGFSGQKRSKWDNKPSEISNTDVSSNFRPLLGLNLSLKYGINMNIRYNRTQSENISQRLAQGGTRQRSSDLSITATYSKSTGFRIPLPIWPFKNKVFKNNVDLSMTFSSGNSISEQKKLGSYVPINESSKWSFAPRMTYAFSDRVRGGMHLEIGKNKASRMGETSIQEFGIDVNISIRGQ